MQMKITSEHGITEMEPPLFTHANGESAVRKITMEMGPCGQPTKVTAELFVPEALVLIKDFNLAFGLPDGRRVTEIHLDDGEIIKLPLAI